MTRTYKHENDSYTFSIYPRDNEAFTVCKNGVTKTVRVVDDAEYTYKLMKTQIKAKGGAEGLYRYVDDALFNHFMECNAWKILNHVIENMKQI
jgi:hypothetical protein